MDGESQILKSSAGHGKRGGWITFPFIIGLFFLQRLKKFNLLEKALQLFHFT